MLIKSLEHSDSINSADNSLPSGFCNGVASRDGEHQQRDSRCSQARHLSARSTTKPVVNGEGNYYYYNNGDQMMRNHYRPQSANPTDCGFAPDRAYAPDSLTRANYQNGFAESFDLSRRSSSVANGHVKHSSTQPLAVFRSLSQTTTNSNRTTQRNCGRPWTEVNEDISTRMIAANSDSPPIIPKRDYDSSTPTPTPGRKTIPKETATADDSDATPRSGSYARHHTLPHGGQQSPVVEESQSQSGHHPSSGPMILYCPPPFDPASGMFAPPPPIYGQMGMPPPAVWGRPELLHPEFDPAHMPPPIMPMLPPPMMLPPHDERGMPFPPPQMVPDPGVLFTPFGPLHPSEFAEGGRGRTAKKNKKQKQKYRRSHSLEFMPPPPFLPFGMPPPLIGAPPPMLLPPPGINSASESAGTDGRPTAGDRGSGALLPFPPPFQQQDAFYDNRSSMMLMQQQQAGPLPAKDGALSNGHAKHGSSHNGTLLYADCESIQRATLSNDRYKKQYAEGTCYRVCCQGFTQVIWIIIGIILVGLILGLVLGLTI